MATTTRKLPVFATMRDVYAVTLRHAGELFLFAWPWLVTLIAVSGALYWLFYPIERDAIAAKGSGSSTLWVLTLIASTLIGAIIAVPWHRRILLGENQTLQSGLALDARKRSYAARAMLLMLAMAAPAVLLFAFLPPVEAETEFSAQEAYWTLASLAWLAALLLLVNRFSLALPATAVGDSHAGFAQAWRASKGNTLRLALVSFLATLLPFILLFMALEQFLPGQASLVVASETTPRMSFTIANVVSEVLALLLGMLYVTFLSLAYRHFAGAMGSHAVRPDAS